MSLSRRVRLRGSVLVASLMVSWFGCSSSANETSTADAAPRGNDGTENSGGMPNINPGSGASGGSLPVLPPEQENESAYELPVLSGRWVWSANPDSGQVALIDTRDLSVRLTRAGYGPTYLAPLRASDDDASAAIVLNVKSADASVMRLSDGELRVSTVPTHEGANAWAVSASGRWAIAWSDVNAIEEPDPSEGFQDVTVIDTQAEPAVATRLSVGFRPSRIFFRSDEGRAFVVSDAGISLIELGDEPSVTEDVPLSSRADETPLDVAVIPDGTHALFRVEGSSNVSIVELASGARRDVTLSGPVTDLDLVADGASAIAVVRGQPLVDDVDDGAAGEGGGGGNQGASGAGGAAGEVGAAGEEGETVRAGGGVSGAGAGGMGGAQSPKPSKPPASGYGPSQVAVLPIARMLQTPDAFESVFLDDLLGSVAVASDGTRAVLYTTASAVDRVTVLATDPRAEDYLRARSTRVRAPVDAVFVSPDAQHALIALRATTSGSIGGAFGIVPLDDPALVKIQTSDAAITGVAFAPSPTTSAILTAASGHTAYLVRFPELRVRPVALPSLPLAAGIVTDEDVGYVVQQHPNGRLSLINLETGEPRTLTGFELSGAVNDGD